MVSLQHTKSITQKEIEMKKVIIVLAMVVSLGLVASQALAQWGPYGGCGMWGPGGGYSANVNPGPADQDFLNDTAELRRDLAGKEAEYDALMVLPIPDPKRAAKLSQEIFDIRRQLRAKAQTYGFAGRGPRGDWHGRHMGPYAGGYCW
jgi:zinc resistance-associated protein